MEWNLNFCIECAPFDVLIDLTYKSLKKVSLKDQNQLTLWPLGAWD